MKQSYIDYIEKTVRSHCKELQELSMGCEFKFFNNINGLRKKIFINSDFKTSSWWSMTYFDWKIRNCVYEIWDLVILWHEIHLEHILRTMGDEWAMAWNGQFLKYIPWEWKKEDGWWYADKKYWEYLIFNLSLSWKDQEEPVLKFLAETMGYSPYEVVTHFGMPHVPPLKITPIS